MHKNCQLVTKTDISETTKFLQKGDGEELTCWRRCVQCSDRCAAFHKAGSHIYCLALPHEIVAGFKASYSNKQKIAILED